MKKLFLILIAVAGTVLNAGAVDWKKVEIQYADSFRYCQKIGVEPAIVVAVARLEALPSSLYPLGYPYVIRVNKRGVRVIGGGVRKLYAGVYDCRNEKTCILLAEELVRHGVYNFDMGVFQLNYYYQHKRFRNLVERAFNTREAMKIACQIIKHNFEIMGRNANAVALYHSPDPKRNTDYAFKFWREYRRIKEEMAWER